MFFTFSFEVSVDTFISMCFYFFNFFLPVIITIFLIIMFFVFNFSYEIYWLVK